MATIEEALQVERLECDIFRGEIVPTTLQRTFGGQVAGQAMVSAVRTVDPEFGVHSLHGYFLRGGNPLGKLRGFRNAGRRIRPVDFYVVFDIAELDRAARRVLKNRDEGIHAVRRGWGGTQRALGITRGSEAVEIGCPCRSNAVGNLDDCRRWSRAIAMQPPPG